jgi:hypothetical protein
MPGFMPGIHVFFPAKTWMAGTSPAMTRARSMRAQEVTDRAVFDGYISVPGTSGLFALEKIRT